MFALHARWATACLLVIFLLGPVVVVSLAICTSAHQDSPGDQELSAGFFAHEAAFDNLVAMLDADREALSATRATVIDLGALRKLLTHARSEQYAAAFNDIPVINLRYFPASGKLFLLPPGIPADTAGGVKSYLHSCNGKPQPLIKHHGYSFRTPGIYLLSGDQPLRQCWFIHHNSSFKVAFAPY